MRWSHLSRSVLRYGGMAGAVLMLVPGFPPGPATGRPPESPQPNNRGYVLEQGLGRIVARGAVPLALVEGEGLPLPEEYRGMLINLAESMRQQTELRVQLVSKVHLDDPRLHDLPLVIIPVADDCFLTPTEFGLIDAYLDGGGLVFVDNLRPTAGPGSARRFFDTLVRDTIGDRAIVEPLTADDPLFRAFYDMQNPPRGMNGRPVQSGDLLAATKDGRPAILFSNLGYTACWDRGDTLPLRFGINLLMYAVVRGD